MSKLPALYETWVAEWLEEPLPQELHANCAQCPMVAPDAPAASKSDRLFFDSEVRCCTFCPSLPNFTVGCILGDERDEGAYGRDSTRARIGKASQASPLAIEPPLEVAIRLDLTRHLFGRQKELRCPHLSDGACGIWPHRTAKCFTYFCKHVRGECSFRLWFALHDVFDWVENELAHWCALELGIPPVAIKVLGRPGRRDHVVRLLEADAGGGAEVLTPQTLWGEWLGREEDYFVECAKKVAALRWPEVIEISGPRLKALVEVACQASVDLQSVILPERLRMAPVQVVSITPESCVIHSYHVLDPLTISRRLWNVLPCFDGRSRAGPEQYPLAQTPLKIILERNVDLSRSGMVTGHSFDGTATVVSAQDPERPELGNIQMKFTGSPTELRQWIVTDQTGEQTTVILGDLAKGGSIPDSRFNIQREINR